MLSRFFQRRTIWYPTPLAWLLLVVLVAAPLFFWWFNGEAFLSMTQRQPAEVLVVEGWIGRDGLTAAKTEFEQGGYRYVVTGGGISKNDWDHRRWNYAEVAGELMIRLGVPADRVIQAPAQDTQSGRTFVTALAVRQAIEAHGLHPTAVNVFTIGAHARRSRLVFAKALGPGIKVGVVAWVQPDHSLGPWWKSSERAEDLIKETVGWFFEAVLNSGRVSNSPGRHEP